LKQLLAPLLRGSVVWLLSEEVAAQPEALLGALSSKQNVGLNCAPSLWSAILDAIDSVQIKALEQSLTALFLGGEAPTLRLIEQTQHHFPLIPVWNLYGPSECTANASVYRISSPKDISIGRPMANTQILLLDNQLQPVPIGVPGELCIGGSGLARGYLNRPELTAEKFIPNPFGPNPTVRLYKTGDLARYRSDGNIEFLGRCDYQVKVRGFRIELGEIEAVLTSHPDVRTAVVVAKGEAESRRLLAFVIPQRRPGPGAIELRQYLRDRLPDYMLPSAFVELETLPLTPSGKVDRRALPEPEAGARLGRRDVTPPRTPVEELVANIWAEVLKRPQVGIEENFFELGGHSLLAMQVMSRIRKAFEVNLPLRLLFESPTVAGLTTALLGRMLEEPEWIDLKKGITKPRGSLSSGTR
jgi:acyl-coenzyme A synthetase/AMP-(fatty) acid ligase/acyl carrier protein